MRNLVFLMTLMIFTNVAHATEVKLECVDAWNFERHSAQVKVVTVTDEGSNLTVKLGTSSMSSLAADWINDFANNLGQVKTDEHVSDLEMSYPKSGCRTSASNPFLISCGSSNPVPLKLSVKNNATGKVYDIIVSETRVNFDVSRVQTESIDGTETHLLVNVKAYLDGRPSEIDRNFSPTLCSVK